ncbi:MAG: hypothetical protein QXZ20_01880, partial [Candidatus Aenigmatarchaeota archaeon]
MVRVFIILNLINLLFLFNIYGETINHNNEITSIIEAVLYLRNPYTKLPPSHFGHPGYEKLSFLYDNAVVALILNAAGYIKEAQEILDYFSSRLNIPLEEIEKRMDTNNIYGILKIFSSQNTSKSLKTIVNTIDITSCRRQGKGILEFYTTPGPISFLIFAMLGINPQKYKEDALILGEVLLAMQAEDGG